MLSAATEFALELRKRPGRLAVWLVAAVAFFWAYGGTLFNLVVRWYTEQDYVYGFLVIPFAALLLWSRRELMPDGLEGSLWGLPLLLLCGVMRVASAYYQYEPVDALSIVPCVAGIVLLIGGWEALLWAWPAVAFLVFMVPLPGRFAELLSEPLQRIGAVTSTYLLQTIGIPAVARGTVIALSQWELGVEEACSGLRMLMLFMAVCTGAALIMRRTPLERVVILLSAAPIAVIANIIRITVTGILYETTSAQLAELVFHDLAGWFMMPLAVVLLWMELALFSLLFREDAFEEQWL